MGIGFRSRGWTPLVSVAELTRMGAAAVTYPRLLSAAAVQGMSKGIAALKEQIATGEVIDRDDPCASFEELNELMGMTYVEELESGFVIDSL